MIKFDAPAGYVFDENNRLVALTRSVAPTDITYIWTTVLNVVGDGYNNGQGNFANGTGPVVLNGYVPTGAILVTVLPAFANTLPNAVVQDCITRMELQLDFSLIFDNSLTVAEDRWMVKQYETPNWFVNFKSTGSNNYIITYRSLAYYFGSVADTRFSFDVNKLVYDPYTGKVLQDFIKILPTNTQPGSNYSLAKAVTANIIGQTVESDGYINDFEVEVSSATTNNNILVLDPTFFQTVTGYSVSGSNVGIYTFFELVEDAVSLSRLQLVPTSQVMYQYPTQAQIEVVKYDYPVGQLFYAYSENVFYMSVQDNTVLTPYYNLISQSQYSVKAGRQGLQFQYRHNSNNTTRIDPATTNIIDLYVVTQSYYTSYQNWIQDTTNTVSEPSRPTINELSQEYGEINNYKMLSDSAIINSVVFKPLFGPKAATNLRATIKVIKASKTNASDSEIRSAVLSAMNTYFDINNWNFGDTFYFSELAAYLHSQIGDYISSAVLVPNDPNLKIGRAHV